MAYTHRDEIPPALKNGVDIQLQSAFADENWPTVIRLADKRAKASGDAYYEIAAIMDRSSNSHDRRFMYWNILLTHMLSLEKAAELTAAHITGQERSLQYEEEFLLYYRVVANHGSVEDFLKLSLNSETGALKQAFDTVQEVLQSFISAKSKIPRMFTKTIGIALLETIFELPPSLLAESDEGLPSPRVEQLLVYIQANIERASAFGDVKGYVERLTFAESKDLLQKLAALSVDDTLWHNTDASGTSTPSCKYCGQPAGLDGCASCFHNIALDSLEAHSKISKDADILERIQRVDKDPRVDLILVSASCLIKLAGIQNHKGHGNMGQLHISFANGARFLQATALLERQLEQTPAEISLQLLLVRVYLLLGWASRALQLWNPLGVKRTVLDALGPLFYDRLSTVAPALFHGSKPLTEGLRTYYATVLQKHSPVKIWDAFTSGSYSSILDMAQFNDNLHRSCTRAMAVLEERRAARAFGGKLEDVESVYIFAEITNDINLVDATDFGSMPNLNCSATSSLAEVLSIGPGLVNTRMHLGLLSEKLLDLMSHKPPKEYKPSKQAEAAQRERAYLLESLAAVESSFMEFLHHPDTPGKLTVAELSHYTIMALLSSLAVIGVTAIQSTAVPSYFADIMSSFTTMYGIARSSVQDTQGSRGVAAEAVLHVFTNLHGLSLFRDTAIAIKQTSMFLTALHDREAARDRSGKSGFHKDVIAATRTLKVTSTQAFADFKAIIKLSKDIMAEPGFQSGVNDWIANSDTSSKTDSADELSLAVLSTLGEKSDMGDWSAKLVGGWREALKGWAMVQLE
ncbi:hypothetical protein CMQ_255 [Grosmannia clavigera kw1407]|uniref:Cytoskeleton organization protein n=1 Tax=Grosmannia clavigera (strain kw1407 / UAMH 11150) TaxID=655863 RepID=F0XQZ4_GROCL|nr:uncharacterized protein CMQ_255 [Grosmannia clavigera kw1407]EFW99937.1 hypothetical protein CMQ_255 [Grosmannia clavigera kw1407]